MKNVLKWYIEEEYRVHSSTIFFLSFQAKKNLTVFDKWASIFPAGISQCLKEYWKERASTAPLDPRFPQANQTK